VGCVDFKSFKVLTSVIEENFKILKPAIENRLKFWTDYAKEIVEKHPKEHFTKKGWKYFKDLDRNE
jgi:hypothetical protein